ncbi:MAG: hypothetical protein R2712_01060 [Vicinamibacterales bacterium]
MNRRQFVNNVSLAVTAAAVTAAPSRSSAAPASALRLRFVGMMAFVNRSDGSLLAATPGRTRAHLSHQAFLMARRGTRAADVLGMQAAHGVVPGAFDMRLDGADPAAFVYRCLHNTTLDVTSGRGAVAKQSSQMAHMDRIAPGSHVRGDIEQWASGRVSLRGGRLVDSAAHPDAGRTWSFGAYRQALTDAVDFHGDAGTELRLTSGAEARTLALGAGDAEDIWVISATTASETVDPTRIEHTAAAFEFLSASAPVIAECADASGRAVPTTELPCSHQLGAALHGAAGESRFPPFSEFCFLIETGS